MLFIHEHFSTKGGSKTIGPERNELESVLINRNAGLGDQTLIPCRQGL